MRPRIIIAAAVAMIAAAISHSLFAAGPPADQAAAPAPATAPATADVFGIRELFPTRTGGREWFAKWNDGHPRTFVNAIDPGDPWFDTDHGDGKYTVGGTGKLTAAGSTVRMYVHDPKKEVEWGENLEITAYITRVSETKTVSYSGTQIFARTNHGTTGNENKNLCDDRGYGAKICLDGRFEFEKETHHEGPKGYSSVATSRPWKEWPQGQTVGVKYVIRNCDHDQHVKVELYRDQSKAAAGGGDWVKITEFIDTGSNWGVGGDPPAAGVAPEMPLIHSVELASSESKKPQISVYFRHEYGTMIYEKMSIREIDPLP